MEDRKDFNPDDLLDRAVDAVLRGPVPDELPPDRVAQLAAVVRQAAEQPCPITLIERITSMKARTKVAIAAAALIAFVGLISWLVPGSGVAVAFADVAEALNSVHSATWKTTSASTLKLPGEKEEQTLTTDANCMFLAPSHERTESTFEGQTSSISIVDGRKGRAIVLHPATKTATVINLKDFPPQENPFGKTFQGLQGLVADAQSGKAGKVERLGAETIDGRPAQGFRVQLGNLGNLEVKLWADPKTLLPLRVEYTSTEPVRSTTVMTDFRVNVPLEESLFAVDVPPGYTVQQTRELDGSKPWAFLTGALKMAAECNDGVFPPALRGEQGVIGVLQRGALTLAEKHKGSPDELRERATDVGMSLSAFVAFLNAAPPDALHYAGKDVKLGTPNRPILWLQRKRDGRCMVFYADLTVKEVPAEEAPKLPESEESPKQ